MADEAAANALWSKSSELGAVILPLSGQTWESIGSHSWRIFFSFSAPLNYTVAGLLSWCYTSEAVPRFVKVADQIVTKAGEDGEMGTEEWWNPVDRRVSGKVQGEKRPWDWAKVNLGFLQNRKEVRRWGVEKDTDITLHNTFQHQFFLLL